MKPMKEFGVQQGQEDHLLKLLHHLCEAPHRFPAGSEGWCCILARAV